MTDIAIKVENLSKLYKIGVKQNRHDTLRDKLTEVVTAPFRRLSSAVGDSSSVIRHRSSVVNSSVLSHRSSVPGPRSSIFGPRSSVVNSSVLGPRSSVGNTHTIWALKDVSFEVKRGEVIGIIGRNGAGKTTLLKILSRITEPTEGHAEIHGRVSSLLEVGTGFHPELSGRENIYLNAAILGMKKAEIERKFDEIVAFAEIEKFIDTPVKHYSSGMYVRLAFAVAAHLEPEILLVDEVLAVGDAEFQKKCLGKMDEVAKEGRTVLFVSHSMPAVQSMCHTGIVLACGQVRFRGPVDQAVQRYVSSHNLQTGMVDLTSNKDRFGSGEMHLLSFWIEDETGAPAATVTTGSRCRFSVEYISMGGRPQREVCMSIHIITLMGTLISVVNTYMFDQNFAMAPSRGIIRFEVPKLPLTAGRYTVDLNLATHAGHTYADFIRGAAAFDVVEGDFYGTGRRNAYGAPVLIEGAWRLEEKTSGTI